MIHAAGLADLDNPAFVRKPLPSIARVLAPKVQGIDNLLACIAQQPLQFVLLFSSVSALVPSLGAGQSDYAMANAHLDAVAQARRGELPIVSLQWGNWRDSGMGETRSPAYRNTGLLSHTDDEGLVLLDRVLARRPAAVVMPVVANPAHWRAETLMARSPVAAPAIRPALPGTVSAPTQGTPPVQDWLRGLVAEQLGLDAAKLDVHTPLQDYGVDSVMLMQVVKAVGRHVKLDDLDPSVVYEHPTVAALSRWLEVRHGGAVPALPAPVVAAPPVASVPLPLERAPATRAAEPGDGGNDIAVVGMSCRFADCNSTEAYWSLLQEGRTAIRPVPAERWGTPAEHVAALLDDVSHFDPKFFLLSQSDARAMDPQALMVLEESLKLWAAAGYTPQEVKVQPIGVYLGGRSQHRPDAEAISQAANPILACGPNYMASNVSRFFDLRGPSLVVDTACSSALVAMNLAVQALRSGEISAAVVGGVSLLDSDAALQLFARRGILNREAQFHLFDRRAQGAVLGEGVGMVLLKTVAQAVADGDQVYAVLKGLAINNDGRTAGPSAPNVQAQKDVMRAALAKSGRQAHDIGYIEANGSGSPVNDLLELKAIEAVYRAGSAQPCQLGSMKPNIGHPLCAEGIAGFIKVVLMLHHRRLVPFLSAQEPMAHYDFAASAFRFARRTTEWHDERPTAAINCFADGGTNAHAVLQAWEAPPGTASSRRPLAAPVLSRINVASPRPVPPAPVAHTPPPRQLAEAVADADADFWK